MHRPPTFQLEYLQRREDIFFLGLKGPRGAAHSFPLTQADMTRLREAYLRALGAPPREEREAARVAAEERMRQVATVASEELGGRPYYERHEIIRLGRETAVVVPMATYRRLRKLEHRVSPGMAELTGPIEVPTVAEYLADREAGTDADDNA